MSSHAARMTPFSEVPDSGSQSERETKPSDANSEELASFGDVEPNDLGQGGSTTVFAHEVTRMGVMRRTPQPRRRRPTPTR